MTLWSCVALTAWLFAGALPRPAVAGGCEDLTVSDETITEVEVHEACGTLTVGPNVSVESTGDLTLIAGTAIRFVDGVQVLDQGVLVAQTLDAPDPLPDCQINFDATCPNVTPECGASFSGGNSCAVAGLPFCYDTGVFSYQVLPTQTLTISFSGDVVKLDLFFGGGGPGGGQMLFFGESDQPVGSALTTNGDCSVAMPPKQIRSFAVPVRRIEVTATGGNAVYIDSLRVNPP